MLLLPPYRPAPAYPPTLHNRKLFSPEHLCRIFSVVAHVKTVLRSAPDEVHIYYVLHTTHSVTFNISIADMRHLCCTLIAVLIHSNWGRSGNTGVAGDHVYNIWCKNSTLCSPRKLFSNLYTHSFEFKYNVKSKRDNLIWNK